MVKRLPVRSTIERLADARLAGWTEHKANNFRFSPGNPAGPHRLYLSDPK
jgi:hypothetical protein